MNAFGETAGDLPGLRERAGAPGPRTVLIDDDASLGGVVGVVVREALGPLATVRQHLRAGDALSDPGLGRADIIVLDLHLPDASGESVLRSLRTDPRTRDAAVLVLTADAKWEKVARLLSSGADGYLFKPFEPRTLGRQLREMAGIRLRRLSRAGELRSPGGGHGRADDDD